VADVASGTPVDPSATLFRPGSISKSFAATAVMQLVEAGQLELDRDVNEYLDFPIPATFATPITLRHLMTHTAGFQDVYKNVLLASAEDTPTLERYVKDALPPRVFEPGSMVAYSNYGVTLAGYIVQRVSGQPYEAYMAKHIFAPLGMDRSTFLQPVPATMSSTGPQGYVSASMPAASFEYLGTIPSGALSSTGADMAKFMLAHLGGGRLGSAQILQPQTVAQMHEPGFRPVPSLPALSLGFYGEDRNGERIIGHAGDLISFHADMHLLLDANVGIFFAMNSMGKDVASTAVRTALFRGFVDRYFPAAASVEEATLASAVEHGKRIEGLYEPSRRAAGVVELGSLFSQAKVTVASDGILTHSAIKGFNGEPKRWREVAPFRWRELHGNAQLVAVVDDAGVQFLSTDDLPPVAVWQPVPGLYQAGWNVPLLGATIAVLAMTLIAWPAGALLRRYYRVQPAIAAGRARLRTLVRVVVLVNLLLLIGWVVFLLLSASDLALLADASDGFIRLLQVLGIASVLGLIPILRNLMMSLREPGRSIWSRLANAIVAVACVATAWFTLAFGLLQVSLKY
jgi:CubicO group peptidase (beta-lactamase class C family)